MGHIYDTPAVLGRRYGDRQVLRWLRNLTWLDSYRTVSCVYKVQHSVAAIASQYFLMIGLLLVKNAHV